MLVNAEALRIIMFRRRISQIALANQSGISRATLSTICNGKSCKDSTAQRIADALNVPLEELKA